MDEQLQKKIKGILLEPLACWYPFPGVAALDRATVDKLAEQILAAIEEAGCICVGPAVVKAAMGDMPVPENPHELALASQDRCAEWIREQYPILSCYDAVMAINDGLKRGFCEGAKAQRELLVKEGWVKLPSEMDFVQHIWANWRNIDTKTAKELHRWLMRWWEYEHD